MTKGKVILKAEDLDGYLTKNDKSTIDYMDGRFAKAIECFKAMEVDGWTDNSEIVKIYEDMGFRMQKILDRESRIHVYGFETPREIHGECSRLISKLRDVKTDHPEFVYYTQRGYELLFNFAFSSQQRQKNYKIITTPVNIPVQNFAVHKIPDVDKQIENSVMCVMLRGALLPSMIM
jgi:uracil phosphoribosyltransferase